MSNDNQSPVSNEPLEYKVFLFDDVLRDELSLVLARRRVLFPRIVKPDPSPIAETTPRCLSAAWAPDTDEPAKREKDTDEAVTVQREIALDEHLAGLAFSGGGIRSASFAIGVLQGLASLKLLNWFDYLSTVSGGGYAGGWLAAWLYREGSPINVESQLDISRIRQSRADRHFGANPGADPPNWKPLSKTHVLDEEPEPVTTHVLDDEPEPVTHLRAYSSFLTPRGGLFSTDTWAMLAIYLRNVFINLLVLLPLLFFLVLFVRWIIEFYSWSLDPAVPKEGSPEEWVLFFVFLGGLALGLFGLGYNARAIWGLRSTPRTFQLGPSKLFWGVVLPLMVAAVLVAPSYEGALNIIRTMAVAILSRLGLGKTALDGAVSNAFFLSPSCLLLHALLFGVPLCLFSLFHILRRDLSSTAPKQRSAGSDLKEPFAAFCGGAVAGILIAVTYELLRFTILQPWLRATIGPPLFLVDIVMGFTVLVALLGSRINELEREWWGRLAGRLLRGALLWLVLVGVIVYGPAALKGFGAIAGLAAQALLAAVWAAITGAGVQAGRSPKTGTGQGPSLLEWLCSLAPPVFLVGLLTVLSLVTTDALEAVASPESPPSSAAPTESSSAASTAEGLSTREQSRQHPQTESKPEGIGAAFNAACRNYFENLRQHYGWVLPISLVITVLVCTTFARLVDVNLFSLHAFYANRLIRAFLGASRPNRRWTQRWGQHDRKVEAGAPTNAFGSHRDADPVTDFDDEDDIDLVDLKIGSPLTGRNGEPIKDRQGKPVACYWGPHYLINTTMNLIASDNLAWRDRKAEAFCLTPLYCGSKSTGFARVTNDTRGNLTLGRAIAVSGAAVDPNMNFHQSPAMTALLTLFNARLGIWIQNPEKEQWFWERGRGLFRGAAGWFAGGPGLGFPLIQELLGQTNNHSDYVHISDGGHFENLGVYELLRRRCRYVVAVDATENANATSDNLGILVRLARIDLGIRILLDTAPLALQGPDRHSKTHVIIGEIRYADVHPKATPGILVYIRASLTGDEPPDVQQYANNHPEFPRQSTADQFFDEDQFESYRALGAHVAREVFEEGAQELTEWLNRSDNAAESLYAFRGGHARLFSSLRNRWLEQPTGDPAIYRESIRAFVKLQRDLRDKPWLSKIGEELYPELADDPRITAEDRITLHTHEQILQVVEDAWLGLGLDRFPDSRISRGWMNWLRRLTSIPSFRRFWPLLRAQYNPGFQSFCERLLRLDADDPRLVELIPSNDDLIPEGQFAEVLDGRISCGVMQVQIIAAEFAREWPDLVGVKNSSGVPLDRLGAQFIHDLVKKSAELELAGQKLDAAWLIVQPPKGHVPKSEPGQDFIVGILIIAAASDPKDGYDLFYWVRPAHRSSGIGEKIIMHKDIVGLHEKLKEHSIQEGLKREKQIRVRYPAKGDTWTRSRWLNFFALHDFKPKREFEPDKDWELCRKLD